MLLAAHFSRSCNCNEGGQKGVGENYMNGNINFNEMCSWQHCAKHTPIPIN